MGLDGSSTYILLKFILVIILVILILVLHGGGAGSIILSSLSLALALSKGILSVRVGGSSSVRHFEHGYLCESVLVRKKFEKWL